MITLNAFNDSEIQKISNDKINYINGILVQVPANSDKNFNFGYMLFIPEEISNNTTLIVEGANTGHCADMETAKQDVIDEVKSFFSLIYRWNETTNFPILTPIFPRIFANEKPIYTHMLTSDVLRCESYGLTRIDKQLIEMINDAKERLLKSRIFLDEKIIIDGFSASSKFANRFTLLHPEVVKLAIGGGISGCLTLPIREINGEKLFYPVGIGDLPEITDEKIKEFLDVKQFYYMGMNDTNDPFAIDEVRKGPIYSDIISESEATQLYKFLGADMLGSRWTKTQEFYRKLGCNVEFGSYEGEGHRPHAASSKVISLLEQNLS